MTNQTADIVSLAQRQAKIVQRFVHPGGGFVAFDVSQIECSVAERFQLQVEKCAHKLAVSTRTTVLSYRQLNGLGNHIARSILAIQGSNPHPVAISLDQYKKRIAAMLGILPISKSCVAQEVTYPEDRLRFMLEFSHTPLNITERHFACRLAGAENLGVSGICSDGSVVTGYRGQKMDAKEFEHLSSSV